MFESCRPDHTNRGLPVRPVQFDRALLVLPCITYPAAVSYDITHSTGSLAALNRVLFI